MASKKSQASYSCFFPIHGLELRKDIGEEIMIGRVTFISAQKISRVRRRLGLHKPVSAYPRRMGPLFAASRVYAVIKSRRAPESHDYSSERAAVRSALLVLAGSMRFSRRRDNYHLDFRPLPPEGLLEDSVAFRHGSSDIQSGLTRYRPVEPLFVDHLWKVNAARNNFFSFVAAIPHSKSTWIHSLRRATELAGASFLSLDLYNAFLLNIIALECLLIKPGEKVANTLALRLGAFFGWVTDEDTQPWRHLSERLYKLRCAFVHDGVAGDLTVDDLLSADQILDNTLQNLWGNLKTIGSKDALVQFLDRVEARRTLGLKVRRRSDRLSFEHHPRLTDRERDRLRKMLGAG